MNLLLVFFLCQFLCLHGLEFTFTKQNETVTIAYSTPTVEIRGTSVPFSVSPTQIWLPTDKNAGCTLSAFSGANGRVAVVNSYKCSYSSKIRNAFRGGAVGLVIQWTEETDPGYNYKWASIGISEEEQVNLPTVEILFNHGEFIIKEVMEDPENTTISFESGDTNKWKQIYEKVTFLVLYQAFLPVLYLLILFYTVYKFARVSTYKISQKKVSPAQVFAMETTSWITYLTVVGCLCALLYLAVDPIHSRGVYNAMAERIFLTISFPSSFISTFLLAFGLHSALNIESKKATDVHLRTIVGFLVVGSLLFSVDLVLSFLHGAYIISERDWFHQYSAGLVYMLFPLAVIIFLLTTVVRYRRITNNLSSTKSAGSFKMANKLVIVSWSLSALYTLWLIAIALGITRFSVTPYGRVSLVWLCFFIVAFIKFAHVYFLPDPRPLNTTESESQRCKTCLL